MSIISNEDKNEVRRYLLGQLDEADEERLELRLLMDPSFGEEFDTVVDEIVDQYAGNEFEGAERERIEQYFLRSAERRQKVDFARELLERAATERGSSRVAAKPGFIERVLAFWRGQAFAFRTAAAVAMIVVVMGVGYLALRRDPGSGTLASISLTINASDRASGTETKPLKLEPGMRAVRVELTLPDQVPQAQNYRVELIDGQERSRNLTVADRSDKSLFVEIEANEITRDTYTIKLYAVNPDGSLRRIRGSYFFNVQ